MAEFMTIRKNHHSVKVKNVYLSISTVGIAKSLLVRNLTSLVNMGKPQYWKVAVIAKGRIMCSCLTVNFVEGD